MYEKLFFIIANRSQGVQAIAVGATLSYDTKEGSGTEFRVTLPLAKNDVKPKDDTEQKIR